MAERWTHELLRAYLEDEERGESPVEGGEWSVERRQKREERGARSLDREEWSVESKAFDGLLDLIDQVKGGVEISDSIEDVNIPGTFDEIDELLNKLYTGDPSSEDKKVFLMGLYHSEYFYQRVLLKMGQLVPALEEELLPSLTDIQIQSDEQILANMNVLTNSKAPAKVDLSYKIPLKFWEKVRKILRSGSPGTRRWVYATVSLSILLIATLSGIRFYNTSYQIMLAEDLLQENYRIYMADTPRLSGGYGSTGISQLMGDDDETYINKALAHIIQALDNESTSSRVQEIQAQIFIINKDLQKAEQIIDQFDKDFKETATVLNDQGVLKFLQKDYETAASLFEQAINRDDGFSEGYYNLALVQEQLGHRDKSVETMNKFLSVELDEGWRSAGKNFINEQTN